MSKDRIGLGVLVSGRGSNLQAIHDAIEKKGLPATIKIVVSDRPETEALGRAERYGLPSLCLKPSCYGEREAHERALVMALKESQVDLVVLAGYLRVVTSILIEPYRHRIMNIHPSLLPAFPGLHAQRQALEYGARISGCTVHFVEEEVDRGPVIVQAAVPVFPDDTVESLSARILQQEHRTYPLAIRWFAEGRLAVEGRRVFIKDAACDNIPVLTNPMVGEGL